MNFLSAVALSLFLHFLLLSWWWLGGMQSRVVAPPTVLQVTVVQQPTLLPEEIENAKKIAEADQAAGGRQDDNRFTTVRTVSTPVINRNLLEELSPYTEMPPLAEVAVEALPEPLAETRREVVAEAIPEVPPADQDLLAREVLAAQVAARAAAAEAARAQAEAGYLSRWFQEIQRIGNAESSRRGLNFIGEARVRFRILPNGRAQAISIQFLSGGSLEITEIIESTIAQIRLPYPKTLSAYQDGLWVDKIWEFSKE